VWVLKNVYGNLDRWECVFANQPKADEAISLSFLLLNSTKYRDKLFGRIKGKPHGIASLAFGRLAKTRLRRVTIRKFVTHTKQRRTEFQGNS